MKKKIAWKILSFIGIGNILAFLGIVIIASAASNALNSAASIVSMPEFDIDLGISASEHGQMPKVQAIYVGVDDTDTPLSRNVTNVTKRWSNGNNPFYNGYRGLCELFCADVYKSAGYSYSGACCAYRHSINHAQKAGKIPKGALIFSGMKPDGTMYENGHRQSAYCDVCNSWAGHVAIYIGNGLVAGSQIPYIESINTWIETFGYGGWSIQ